MGTASLHASLIGGGRELSSYPDQCWLKLERRTVSGETDASVLAEIQQILGRLSAEDTEFEASVTPLFSRPSYEIASSHALPLMLQRVLSTLPGSARAAGVPLPPAPQASDASALIGMSFWTDAAVLGGAGIPSVLFGPGGAGLHSIEEYVEVADVLHCRDTLAALARGWCSQRT